MSGPIYVHSDLFVYLAAFPDLAKGCSSAEQMSENAFAGALRDLEEISDGPVVVPAYNYSFPKNGIYDLRSDASEVGLFSELFRRKYLSSRSYTPVFSTCCNRGRFVPGGPRPSIDPFGADADFDRLIQADGSIVSFGSSFAPTFIIHIERQIEGGPLYRYDKTFDGELIDLDGTRHALSMIYLVRPWNTDLIYDLTKVERDLEAEGILEYRMLRGKLRYSYCNAAGFMHYALGKLGADPFYFLTPECVKNLTAIGAFKHGRARIQDFE